MQYKLIKREGLEGVVDEHDNIIIPCIYNYIDLNYNCLKSFTIAFLRVKNKDNLYGIINTKNEVIIPCIYYFVHMYDFKEFGLICIKNKGGLCGLINIKNEIIIPCRYYDIDVGPNFIIARDLFYRRHYYKINSKHKLLLYNKVNVHVYSD